MNELVDKILLEEDFPKVFFMPEMHPTQFRFTYSALLRTKKKYKNLKKEKII